MAAAERWYFTEEQIKSTPSVKCGYDIDKELCCRQQAANFIQDMGIRLQVNQLCINTAIVYMHRFYMFHSFTRFHRTSLASASLFLAAKVEEQPRKLEHIIKVAQVCLHRDQPFDVKSEAYNEQAQDLIMNENILLQTLGFDVAIDHPHTHIVKCCQLVRASKDLAQTSYFMASYSLHLTTMCLQYKPTVVACFCIHLACKWSDWEFPNSNEGRPWFWYVDKSVTSELLERLTNDFLSLFEKCPSRLKKKIASLSQHIPQNPHPPPPVNQQGANSSGCTGDGTSSGLDKRRDAMRSSMEPPHPLALAAAASCSISATGPHAAYIHQMSSGPHMSSLGDDLPPKRRNDHQSLSSRQSLMGDPHKKHHHHHHHQGSSSNSSSLHTRGQDGSTVVPSTGSSNSLISSSSGGNTSNKSSCMYPALVNMPAQKTSSNPSTFPPAVAGQQQQPAPPPPPSLSSRQPPPPSAIAAIPSSSSRVRNGEAVHSSSTHHHPVKKPEVKPDSLWSNTSSIKPDPWLVKPLSSSGPSLPPSSLAAPSILPPAPLVKPKTPPPPQPSVKAERSIFSPEEKNISPPMTKMAASPPRPVVTSPIVASSAPTSSHAVPSRSNYHHHSSLPSTNSPSSGDTLPKPNGELLVTSISSSSSLEPVSSAVDPSKAHKKKKKKHKDHKDKHKDKHKHKHKSKDPEPIVITIPKEKITLAHPTEGLKIKIAKEKIPPSSIKIKISKDKLLKESKKRERSEDSEGGSGEEQVTKHNRPNGTTIQVGAESRH